MDPVRAMCTRATYPVGVLMTFTTSVVVTHKCYRSVPVPPPDTVI